VTAISTPYRIIKVEETDEGIVRTSQGHYTNKYMAQCHCDDMNAAAPGMRKPRRPDLRDATGELLYPAPVFEVETID
jgi:hypothetical protein